MRISDWSSDVCSSDLFGTDSLIGYQPYLHVFGEIQQYRTRPARGGQLIGFGSQGSHVFRTPDLRVPLGNRAGNTNGITFLEGVGTYGPGRHLTTDAQHGD